MIETDRLLLRPIVLEDYHDIFEYSRHPEVGPNAGWKPHENEEETVKVMRDLFLLKEHVFAIVLKEKDRVAGSIGLITDPKRDFDECKMLGYAIGRPYWGKGLMTEAVHAMLRYGFHDLKLDIISAYCFPHNIASRRVLEKCGFLYEGLLRMADKIYTGEILDNYSFSIKKEEYSPID